MKTFKFCISFIWMVIALLPMQAQKLNLEKGKELSEKMLAPNAKQLMQTPAKQQGNLLRSANAAGQPVDLGNGVFFADPSSSVVEVKVNAEQYLLIFITPQALIR